MPERSGRHDGTVDPGRLAGYRASTAPPVLRSFDADATIGAAQRSAEPVDGCMRSGEVRLAIRAEGWVALTSASATRCRTSAAAVG